MKKSFLWLLCCGICLSAVAQGTYRLTGELVPDSRKGIKQLYLLYVDEFGDSIRFDSAQIKKGRFTFSGTVPSQVEKVSLSGFPQGQIDFFLDSAELTTGRIDINALEKVRVIGSHNNEVYNHVKDIEEKNRREMATRLEAYKASLPSCVQNDSKLRQQYVDAEKNRLASLARLDVLDFIADNMYEPIAVWLVNDYARNFFSSYTLMYDVLQAFPVERHLHSLYQEMLSFARSEDIKQGSDAPVIVGRDLQGQRLSSADLKGKYVLIHFWSSTDSASVADVPYLKEALQAAKQFERFSVLSYSFNTAKQEWLEAVDRLGMTHERWYHASDLKGLPNSKAARLYKLTKVPYSVLINPKGLIVAFELHGRDMVDKVVRIAEGIESYE